MTPRSRRYFARKYSGSILEKLMPVFENISLVMKAMEQLHRPRPNYAPGTPHPGYPAIVGEVGPELVQMKDGSTIIVNSRFLEINQTSYAERILANHGLLTPRSPKMPPRDPEKRV